MLVCNAIEVACEACTGAGNADVADNGGCRNSSTSMVTIVDCTGKVTACKAHDVRALSNNIA